MKSSRQKTDRIVPLEHKVFHPLTGITTLKKLNQVWSRQQGAKTEPARRWSGNVSFPIWTWSERSISGMAFLVSILSSAGCSAN